MTQQRPIALTLAALVLAACGGTTPGAAGTAAPAGQTVVVATSPAEAEVVPGGTIHFGAQVTGTANAAVTWQVAEPDGGTVDAVGLYTAPATEGTFHVRAVSAASAKSTGSSVIRVKKGAAAQVLVAIDPATATVPAGGSTSFTATVTGTTTRTVTWTIQEGSSCGSVSTTGAYLAPNEGATCHVVATSVADPTRSATVTVTVMAAPPPTAEAAIAISPTSAALDACAAQAFTATVTGTSNTAVTWTVLDADGGTVNGGAYVAPATPGTYRIRAASVADPSRTVQATVTVGPERVLSVAVTPGSGSVAASGTLALSALVTTTCGTFAAQ